MHSWGLGGHLVCGYRGIWIDMVLWWDLSWEYNGIQRDVTNNIQYDIGVCLNMEEWWKMRPNCNLKVGKMDEHQGEPWYFGSTPFWDKPRKLHEIGGIFLGEWWYEWKISMAFFMGDGCAWSLGDTEWVMQFTTDGWLMIAELLYLFPNHEWWTYFPLKHDWVCLPLAMTLAWASQWEWNVSSQNFANDK